VCIFGIRKRKKKLIDFENEKINLKYLEQTRWVDGICCPHCGHKVHYDISGKNKRKGIYRCANRKCDLPYNVFSKTPLANSKNEIWVTLTAIHAVLNNPFITSPALAKVIGVTQKSAYYLKNKILSE